MSDSVRPHRRQPTRLPRPWDSPGKNTGVGCHLKMISLGKCMHAKSLQLCLTLCDPADCSSPCSSVCGNSPGKNTGMGCHAFPQEIFLTQASNSGLMHYRQILCSEPLALLKYYLKTFYYSNHIWKKQCTRVYNETIVYYPSASHPSFDFPGGITFVSE